MSLKTTRRQFGGRVALAAVVAQGTGATAQVIDIGGRRELFVDDFLIGRIHGARLELGRPVDAGPAIRFDRPWEGPFSAYTTIIRDGGIFRMYYRGVPESGRDGNESEVTCTAESADGITWRRPELNFYDARGTRPNNVILAGQAPLSHNFSPFLDARPGVPASERYKALAGIHKTGLIAFVSSDGLAWRRLRDQAVFPSPDKFSLDSQNVSFWSEAEGRYLLYFRTWKQIGKTNYRWVSRAASPDFIHWSKPEEMDFGSAAAEHLYTSQTSPYFRAPQIYVGICARFMSGRQVLTEAQAKSVGVDPKYFKDCSDAVLITTRGGTSYRRQFMEAFLRPGVGWENWVSRSNYPALNIVQTGSSTMSFFVNRNYGQPTAYLRRYELRLDGLASVRAGYSGGELLTKPLIFNGARLELNYSTSAPGSVRVEVQDASGVPLPGFTLDESLELVGDEINRVYAWKSDPNVAQLSGKPVCLRFVLKDADLYSFCFTK